MLGKNRWAMFLIASLLIGATAALPAASAQDAPEDGPASVDPCDGGRDLVCHEGNDLCLVWVEGLCTGERPITGCHSDVEISCEEPGGDVCLLYVEEQVDPTNPTPIHQPVTQPSGCLIG